MTDKENKNRFVDKEYEELVLKLKEELPNIILPSMGMLEDIDSIDIDGKDFVIGDKEV